VTRLGNVIILLVTAAFLAGLFLVVTAFSRKPPATNDVPPAKIVVGTGSPIRPDKRRISAGRLIGGLFLIALAAGVMMVLLAGADLARVSSH